MALTKASRSMLNTGISDSSDATALTFSSAEDATFAGHVILGDNKYLKMGASNDLLLVHDGSSSYIIDNGTGNLVVAGSAVYIKNAAYNEQMISAIQDAQVELYYNNALKLATANDGIDVTGKIDCTTFESTGAATVGGNLTVTGNLQVDGTTTTINSTTYTVDDLNITLASGAGSSSAADGAGLTIDGASATWNYTHSNTSWVANKTVRAPTFVSTSNAGSTLYALETTRSGSGTSSPDIYGSSNTLVLGYAAGSKAVSFNSSGADFAGTITSAGTIASGGNITAISASSPTLEIKDTTNNVQFKAYAQDTNAHLGTISNHSLIIDTNNTAAISIDSSQNTTISNHLIVDGNTTLGNADTDTVTVPGPLAVDTDTLYVDVTNDKIGINVGTSPSNALSVSGVITSGNFSSVGVGGTPGDANTAELGPGYLNLARDDTAAAKQITFGKNGAVHSYLETTSSGLHIGGANVGIGTSSPAYTLEVKKSVNNDWISRIYNEGTTDASGLLVRSDTAASQATAVFGVYSDGAYRMIVRGNGKVGIGTSSPLSHLTFESAHFNTGTESGPSIRWNNGITTADSLIQNFEDANVAPFVIGMNSHIPSGGSFAPFNSSYPSSHIYMAASGAILFGTASSGTGSTKLGIGAGSASSSAADVVYTSNDAGIRSTHYANFEFVNMGGSASGQNTNLKKALKESVFGSYNVNFDVGVYSGNSLYYVGAGKGASTDNSYIKFKVALNKATTIALNHECGNSADGTTRTLNIDYSFDDVNWTNAATGTFTSGTLDQSANLNFNTIGTQSSGGVFTGNFYIRFEFKGGSSGHETLIGWRRLKISAEANDMQLINPGGPQYGPVEAAMFRLHNASTITSNNSGFLDLRQHSNGGYMNPEIFEVDTSGNYGIHIKRDGKVWVNMNQDIITTDSTGYISSRIYRAPANDANNRVMSYQLITNTNSQWDSVHNTACFDVNAGDRIQFYLHAAAISSLDTTSWSQYSIMWMDSQHSGSANRAVATYQENAHFNF